jgi:glycosyltransferase involved in cell wall biosynthesis
MSRSARVVDRSTGSEGASPETIRVAHVATVDMTHRFLLLGQLRRLRDSGFDVTAISAPGPHVSDLQQEGIRFLPWGHATREWDPVEDANAFLELVRIFRRHRFHVVHTHTPKAGFMGRVAAKLTNVPIVVNTVHGYYATPEHPPARRLPVLWMEWLAARCSDLELFQSAEDLAWARRARVVRPKQGVLLGNGTDLGTFDPSNVPAERLLSLRQGLGIPDGAPVVGTIGRMVAEKGYREFFQVARDIRRTMPEARFVAVGDPDPDKGDAITRRELAAAADDVIFTGRRDDVVDLLALFDVFVLASWREGLPRSAIEAAAMGTPLVLTDIRGCREVVREGVEGLLVRARHPSALAEAVRGLLRDPDSRARMGANARRRAVIDFDERRVAATVSAAYLALLRARGIEMPSNRVAERPGPVERSA